jgi:hypothetical protein
VHPTQSLNTKEVSAPQPAKSGLEAGKDEASPGIVKDAGKASRLPPKPWKACQWKRHDRSNWIEDSRAGRCRSSRRSLSVRNAGAKTGTKSSPRRLRSIANIPTRRALPARSEPFDRRLPQARGRRLRIRATGQLIASFGHAGEAQAKLGATPVAQKVQWSLVRPSRDGP